MTPQEETPQKPSFTNNGTAEFDKLLVGHTLSMTSYMKVLDIDGMNIKVRDQRGEEFTVMQPQSTMRNNLVNNTMHSAQTFHKEVKTTRTKLLEIFMKAGDAVFTVQFRKQVDPVKAFETLKTGNKLRSHAEQKELLKEALRGEVRTMTAHLLDVEHGMGRSLVYDLSAQSPKQVDHRQVDWLILKGVKYVV